MTVLSKIPSMSEVHSYVNQVLDGNKYLSQSSKFLALALTTLKDNVTKKDVLKLGGATLAGLILLYLRKVWLDQQTFKRMGVKTPKYRFFWGNTADVTEDATMKFQEWTKQLGKTYGYYDGHLPVLVTSDLDLIQEIFIQKYSNFAARKKYPFVFADDHPVCMLFFAAGDRWKHMRQIMNPMFSTVKMREMGPLIDKTVDKFCSFLEDSTDKDIQLSELFQRFAMESLWSCGFGIDADFINNPSHLYYKRSLNVFENFLPLKSYYKTINYIDEFRPFILSMAYTATYWADKLGFDKIIDPLFWLNMNILNAIGPRLKAKSNRRDMVQLLIESNKEIYEKTGLANKKEFSENRRQLTPDEISYCLVNLLLAGYESTSTTLTYAFLTLSLYNDELVKLQDEIDQFYAKNPNAELNVDNVDQLEYLDMFIKEVLRFYPVVGNAISRRCIEPTTAGGIKIPVGLGVHLDVMSLHMDPEQWGPVDPYKFYPLRFHKDVKRNPLAYVPWGVGARNCLGKKFAVLELKMLISKMVHKFDVAKSENTPKLEEIKYLEYMVRKPTKPISMMLKKRQISSA